MSTFDSLRFPDEVVNSIGYAHPQAHMTKISFFYPNKQAARFDLAYYIEKHMPWAIGLLSTHPGYKGVSVERGISGGAAGDGPAYVAMCHYLFDSFDSFIAAATPHLAALQADIKNYTDLEPVFQVSEVLLAAANAGANLVEP